MAKKASQRETAIREYAMIYPRYVEMPRLLPPEERVQVYDAMFDALLFDKWPSAEARANMSIGAALMVEQFERGWHTSVNGAKNGKRGGLKTQERRRQAEQGVDTDTGEVTEDDPTQTQAPAQSVTTPPQSESAPVDTPPQSPKPTSPTSPKPTHIHGKEWDDSLPF